MIVKHLKKIQKTFKSYFGGYCMILFPEKPVFFVAQNLKKTKAIGLE